VLKAWHYEPQYWQTELRAAEINGKNAVEAFSDQLIKQPAQIFLNRFAKKTGGSLESGYTVFRSLSRQCTRTLKPATREVITSA